MTAQLASLNGRLGQLGFGLKETVDVYEGFNAVARQSFATSQEAAGAMLQLSQALGSGRLNGDEFVRISESMPGLLGIIAAEMNVNVGALKKLGSEGKITSQILVSALSKVAQGGIDVTATFTPMQKAMITLSTAAENFGVAATKIFGPAFIAAVQATGQAIQFIVDTFQYLAATHGPAVEAAFNKVSLAISQCLLMPIFKKSLPRCSKLRC